MPAAVSKQILGIRDPQVITSEAALVSELRSRRRPIADVSFKSSPHQKSTFAALKVGDLLLTETSTDPIVWKSSPDAHLSFVLPTSGNGEVREGSHSVKWGGSHQILQLNYSHPTEAHSGKSHVVAIVPPVGALKASLMDVGMPEAAVLERHLDGPTGVHSGIFNGVDYYHHLRELISIVRLANGDEEFLARIGIDEIFYRLLAEMLVAGAGHGSDADQRAASPTTRSARAVDNICDHIRGNIGTPLTIPRMEALTGLTGRALNYAFQSRFACSPQEWQRNFLLDLARERLSFNETAHSVKSISFDLGFASSSSFASHYRRRFGELPSDTMRLRGETGPALALNRDDYEI